VLLLFFALKLRSTGGIALNLLLNSFWEYDFIDIPIIKIKRKFDS
jgi:hypothetical protein